MEVPKRQKAITATVEDSQFFSEVFSYVAKKRKINQKFEADNLRRVLLEEYEDLSHRIDLGGVQYSCSIRNNLKSRRLANLLIDDKGHLITGAIEHCLKILKEHTYFIGPGRQHDSVRQEHIIKILELLLVDKKVVSSLHSLTKPHMHPIADQIIRDTLQLPVKTTITNADTRKAVLSALFCYLRQALGSCFATAPAIVVHDEQPIQFLNDIIELLNTGRITRTFSGKQYSVPLSVSSGVGDLKRPLHIPGDPKKAAEVLSLQPGLMAALEMEGGVDPNSLFKENCARLNKMLFSLFKKKNWNFPVLFTTPERLIIDLLLQHFSLTKEDVEEVEGRVQGPLVSKLVAQSPRSAKGSGGLGEKVSQYKVELERAKSAFKALSDNALLRAWEYSLASFAETKAQFAKWNLYSSLGMQHQEAGGIGQCLWKVLKEKLEQVNRKTEDLQFEYEQMYAQVKIRERRLRDATSEEEARWLKIDYRAKVTEMQRIQEERDKNYRVAERITHLYDHLINYYLELFPTYFQEVYDPEMVDVTVGLYDDSPAGFRLIYKHGRSNTSQWTFIRNSEEYIDSLVSFFMAAERQVDLEEQFQGMGEVIGEITTDIINHIRTKEFLETALYRMAAAHKVPIVENPVENIDKVEKKPWVYTSGGSLHTLVSVYFCREDKPRSSTRWVESAQELLVFFADTVKELPYKDSELFKMQKSSSMLCHSPTHAFLLKPGSEKFIVAWDHEEYTYTLVRDRLILPMERAIQEITLNPDMIRYLVKRLSEKIPFEYQHYFREKFQTLQGSMSPAMFRDFLVYTMERESALQMSSKAVLETSVIDSELYSHLPLFPIYHLKERVKMVLSKVEIFPKDKIESALALIDEFSSKIWGESVMGAKQFQEVCLSLICLVTEKTSFSVDIHQLVYQVCIEEKFALPKPIIVADTNWVTDYFAFLVNPGTGKLEFWRVDYLGREGAPMDAWNHWLDGSRREPDWGIFNQIKEYSGL